MESPHEHKTSLYRRISQTRSLPPTAGFDLPMDIKPLLGASLSYILYFATRVHPWTSCYRRFCGGTKAAKTPVRLRAVPGQLISTN